MMETLKNMTNGRMADFIISQFQQKGGLYRLPLPMTAIVVANMQDARAISKNPANLKPHAMYGAFNNFSSGPNIVTLPGKPGDSWHHRRKAVSVAFKPKSVKRMNEVAIEKATAWIDQTLHPLMERGKPFNVGMEMIGLTIAVICETAFDYNISHKDCTQVLEAIEESVSEFSIKTMLNPLRRFGTWFLKDRQKAFRGAELLHDLASKIIDAYRNNPAPTPETVIDCIMRNENYKGDSERIPDIIMVLFAGHDTTGSTLALALRDLALNPKEQQLLRKATGSHSQENDDGNAFLKAVLNETMRLHPVAPVTTAKQLAADYVSKMNGCAYVLPKGSIVFIAQIAISYDSTLFPDPFQFQPARWLESDEKFSVHAKQALNPFSLGKRSCVGQSLAMAELKSVLSLLIRRFHFEIVEAGEVVVRGTLQLENCLLSVSKAADS